MSLHDFSKQDGSMLCLIKNVMELIERFDEVAAGLELTGKRIMTTHLVSIMWCRQFPSHCRFKLYISFSNNVLKEFTKTNSKLSSL